MTLNHPLGGRRAWAVWATAVAVYILAIFHRTSLGVAGIVAADRFGISSAELATFAMVQLGVYAAMQIPVGALLDRFGSRALLAVGLTIMTVAQLGFAFAGTYGAGLVARVLLGVGDAMVFVSVLRLVALWFPPARTPIVTQITGLSGQVGSILAAYPLALTLDQFGWTTSFLMSAGVGVVLSIALLVIVRDSPYADQERTELKMRAVARAVRLAWREPGTRLGLWCHFTAQFSSNVFAVMWGFPFLTAGQGLSTEQASVLLALMVLTGVCASPAFGVFVARYPYSRSTLVLWLVGATMVVWGVVLAWPGQAPMWMLVVMVMVTAAGGPGSMVGFDLARTFNPSTRLGSATGIVNVGGFAAALGTVALIGVVLDVVAPGGPTTYTVDSFREAMAVQYLIWVTGVIMIVRYRRRTRALVASDQAYAYILPAKRFDPGW